METLANTILPHVTKGAIFIGVIMCLVSITIVVYLGFRKKKALKEVKTCLEVFVLGIFVGSSGLILDIIANFQVSFDSYKRSIPIGYIVLLVACILFTNMKNSNTQQDA